MRPIALRRRVSELQLQWSFFFVIAVGLVAVPLYLQLGRVRVKEQVALAQMASRNVDGALSAHFQILQEARLNFIQVVRLKKNVPVCLQCGLGRFVWQVRRVKRYQ